jgi:hypothetical protein
VDTLFLLQWIPGDVAARPAGRRHAIMFSVTESYIPAILGVTSL